MALRHDLARALGRGDFKPNERHVVEKVLVETLPPRLGQAFRFVESRGRADYASLASGLGLHRVHAARLLKELTELGLLERDTSGRPFIYSKKGTNDD